MSAETSAFKLLRSAAEKIDDGGSWQVLGGSGNVDEDNFELDVVSRGPVRLIEIAEFSGIAASVTISNDPEDPSYSKIHFLKYAGGLVGLEVFVLYLTDDLGGISEGSVDVVNGFVSRNPLVLLNILGNPL